MGNTLSADASDSDRGHRRKSRVLFFLHRTWAVIVTEKWMTRRRTNQTDTTSEYDSQYTVCSCSQCQRDDTFSSSSYSSELFETEYMAPNIQEVGKVAPYPFGEDITNKEKQRPPIYNPEDYALSLKKWGRKPPGGGPGLYASTPSLDTDCLRNKGSSSFRDYSNPMLISSGNEMTLRQFGTVSELLAKLKADLRLAYPSFIQEFVSDPLDGLTLLLELLRAIQLSQCNTPTLSGVGSSNTTGKISPAIQRRALLDEHSCLQCLLSCCMRYSDAIRKLSSSSAGLFALAVCIMSNVNKSRIIALQLLAKACEPVGDGHTAVSEALSTLRLRFGEPVRFRFLVGTLMSAGGQGELLAAGMNFVNTFLDTAGSAQKRLYVQAELEQAGFDVSAIKKNVLINSPQAEKIFKEIGHWEKNHINIEALTLRVRKVEKENDTLRDKVLLLERRIQILQEEKGVLISLEQCLKDRCSELQDEVASLKSCKSIKQTDRGYSKRSDSTPAEDEGISSSERSMTPEGDPQRESSIYEMYSVQSQTISINNTKNHHKKEEEETTIDDVIEELRNIINDAETEHYLKEESMRKQKERGSTKIDQNKYSGKIVIKTESCDSVFDPEVEIVPSNLHPQPPRKARSLIQVYVPTEDYECDTKEIFFENETNFTSDEGSDSLLSASRYQLQEASKNNIKRSESFRHVLPKTNEAEKSVKHSSFDGMFYANNYSSKLQKDCKDKESRIKSKSLDRIDDGLDAMVDIVVTEQSSKNDRLMPKTESCNKILARSISNVFINSKKEFNVSKLSLSQYSDEKQRMFLPPKKFDCSDRLESPYYFPRVQEKKTNSSFLIKRGHTNAGLYSGYILRDNTSTNFFKSIEYSCGNGKNSVGKVTDLPSGLY